MLLCSQLSIQEHMKDKCIIYTLNRAWILHVFWPSHYVYKHFIFLCTGDVYFIPYTLLYSKPNFQNKIYSNIALTSSHPCTQNQSIKKQTKNSLDVLKNSGLSVTPKKKKKVKLWTSLLIWKSTKFWLKHLTDILDSMFKET